MFAAFFNVTKIKPLKFSAQISHRLSWADMQSSCLKWYFNFYLEKLNVECEQDHWRAYICSPLFRRKVLHPLLVNMDI